MARAGIAAGADGLLVEVHHQPEKALSDGPQALLPEQFAQLMEELEAISRAIGRSFSKDRAKVNAQHSHVRSPEPRPLSRGG